MRPRCPLNSGIHQGTKLSTDGLNGALFPAGLPVATVKTVSLDARRRHLQLDSATGGQPSTPGVPGRHSLGALCVRRVLVPVTLVTLLIVAIQLSIFSSWRVSGVVIMIVWLWPLAMGLAGMTALALWCAILAGVFFDTHSVTPFGLTAIVALALAYGASRLGKEGVGDLDSAAWWVTPAIGAAAGFVAPAIFVGASFFTLEFFTVARQSSDRHDRQRRGVRRAGATNDAPRALGEQRWRKSSMKGSWRNRPTGSRFSRLWRPWVSLHPFRGRGLTINERKTVGIRDLMASPDEVESRPARRWIVIGGFFVILFIALDRATVLSSGGGLPELGRRQCALNSLRQTTIPATRGEILDREGHAARQQHHHHGDSPVTRRRRLYPAVKGSLSSLTGISVKKIQADLDDQQYSPYQPAPIMANAPAQRRGVHQAPSGRVPGVSVLDVVPASLPQRRQRGGPSPGLRRAHHQSRRSTPTRERDTQADSTIGKTGIEGYYESYLRGKQGKSKLEVSSTGHVLRLIKTTQPTVGDSVVLNIDTPLQTALGNYLSLGDPR